jgi:GNAT superfamily N-acetyltransferase
VSDALAPMRANMRAFYRLLGQRAPHAQLLERRGLVAAFVPSAPNRSIVNAVVFERHDELAASRAELAARYEQAGIRAWTVWVQQDDRASAELLHQAGHHLDASPRAMTLDLRVSKLAGVGELDWEHTRDARALAEINETAYGLPPGEFTAAMSGMSEPPVILYLARVEGTPAACVATLDEAADCGVYFVATAPIAQKRGLASALLRQALVEAQERGCRTSSLQATAAGRAVYARLGYRDVCALEMWEHRRN